MSELEKMLKKILNMHLPEAETHVQKRLQETEYALSDIVNFVQEKLEDPTQKCSIGYKLSILINAKITEHEEAILKTNPKGYATNKEHPNTESKKMYGLGYKLPRGELTIEGDTGNSAGLRQIGGTLRVKGNTGNGLSKIKKGGKTIVEKNAGKNACNYMEGGLTIVKGNMGNYTCPRMKGGMLIVEGKVQGFGGIDGGIIIEKNKIKKLEFEGWDIHTIAPIGEFLPKKLTEKILKKYMKTDKFKNWRTLVQKPKRYGNYECHEYELRLRLLDQELPAIIRKISNPEKRLNALKVLEQETCKNPTREIIKLTTNCGTKPEEAIRKYNQKLVEVIREYRKRIREVQKEFL